MVKIKRTRFKALAIIQSNYLERERAPWALPIGDNSLVCVTWEYEDYEQKEKQQQHTAKLMKLARGASEVLLLRCLRNKGVKAVHIASNRNGNPRSTATVIFENNQDLRKASRKPIRYYNYTLYWKLKEETYLRKEKEVIFEPQKKSKNIIKNEEPQTSNKNQNQERREEKTIISSKDINKEDKKEVDEVWEKINQH